VFLCDEALVDAGRGGGLRPVIFHDELELPTEKTALVIRVLDTELVPAQLVLPQRRIGPGLGRRGADADRRLRLDDRTLPEAHHDRHDAEVQAADRLHRR
jgi:hypothetical protein